MIFSHPKNPGFEKS
jgi:hypothetical protein